MPIIAKPQRLHTPSMQGHHTTATIFILTSLQEGSIYAGMYTAMHAIARVNDHLSDRFIPGRCLLKTHLLQLLTHQVSLMGQVKCSIGPLKKPDGSTTTTSEESAEALACFFKSVFIHEDLQELPDFPSRVSDAIPDLVTEDWYIINFQNPIPQKL